MLIGDRTPNDGSRGTPQLPVLSVPQHAMSDGMHRSTRRNLAETLRWLHGAQASLLTAVTW